MGIPVRKVPAVLRELTGVRLTQGGITPDALRRAKGTIGSAYEPWRAAMPEAPVVHTEDAGWRVGGERAHLRVFETVAATVYRSRSRPRHEEVQEGMPADYAGVMVTDRGRRYDAQAFAGVPQRKCLAHLWRSIEAVLETKTGRGRDVGEQLKALLQDAWALWHAHHEHQVADFKAEAEALQAELTYVLRDRRLKNPDNHRLLNALGWPHDRGHGRRFLTDPRIEPTNHRAQRALRPAVIARQVPQCSKTAPGAQAFAAFASVVRTLAKNGIKSLVEGLDHLFRFPTTQGVSP